MWLVLAFRSLLNLSVETNHNKELLSAHWSALSAESNERVQVDKAASLLPKRLNIIGFLLIDPTNHIKGHFYQRRLD